MDRVIQALQEATILFERAQHLREAVRSQRVERRLVQEHRRALRASLDAVPARQANRRRPSAHKR